MTNEDKKWIVDYVEAEVEARWELARDEWELAARSDAIQAISVILSKLTPGKNGADCWEEAESEFDKARSESLREATRSMLEIWLGQRAAYSEPEEAAKVSEMRMLSSQFDAAFKDFLRRVIKAESEDKSLERWDSFLAEFPYVKSELLLDHSISPLLETVYRKWWSLEKREIAAQNALKRKKS